MQIVDFGYGYIPTNVIIGKNGRIFYVGSTFEPESYEEMIQSAIMSFQTDNYPPQIIELEGTTANVNDSMILYAAIEDNSVLDTFVGNYDIGNGEEIITFYPINQLSQRNQITTIYKAEIPSPNSITNGNLYLNIIDEYGNETISENFEIKWVDETPPWILHLEYEIPANDMNGVATAAEFINNQIYVSYLWESDFLIYDLDGNFSENYINGVGSTRDMAFDGQNLYLSQNDTNIQVVNIAQNEVTGVIPTPCSFRTLAYDPDLNGFWGNDGSGIIYCIDDEGNQISSLQNLGGVNANGMCHDNLSEGGPFLWIFDRGNNENTPQKIRQISIEDEEFTGVEFNATLALGYGIAGGLFITDQIEEGVITIGGVLKSFGPIVSHKLFVFTLGNSYNSNIEENGVQEVYLDANNFPNPFHLNETRSSNGTEISFINPENQNIQINIYNTKGQLVRNLENRFRKKGKVSVLWDGKTNQDRLVSSGIYFYNIKAGDISKTKKMLLYR